MNPGNFQNMAAPRPQGNPPLGGMQRNGGASTDIRPFIYKLLQSQQIPSGWQATLEPRTRIGLIHQMVTQLLIVKPDMGPLDAANVAASYEMGEFQRSIDRATYEAALRQKLSDIHQTRQNQANIQQQQFQTQIRQVGQMGQMVPAQMGPTQQQMLAHRMAQNQMQQGFGMQQPPQPGQPLPNSMQQQPPQHQTMLQLGNGSDVQQPIHNGQPLRPRYRT
ncbi:hypothetical protein ABVK25_003572 [Lepraria finkii]|uniref:Mediator complex subunit 15 KIX domain-containing protein n=1 Tax=Lepraria finkii TaxID=1340010 RepID=A0ABR4BDW8_9LECA